MIQPHTGTNGVGRVLSHGAGLARPGLARAASVLVVEDDLLVSTHISEELVAMGYQLAGVARSGPDAMALSAHGSVDIVLMDIHIKGSMDGIEAAIALRQRQQVPVVYLTGHSDDATWKRALQSEPDGYLVKPFTSRDLRTAIELALRKHGRARETQLANEELTRQQRASEQRIDEITLLNELNEQLQGCRDANLAYATLVRFCPLLWPTLAGSIALLDEARSAVETVAEWGGNSGALVFSPDDCHALKHRRQHQWQPGADEGHCRHHEPLPGAATLCQPLVADEAVIGVFCLRYVSSAALTGPVAARVAEWRFASAVSQQIATALGNLRLRERLQSESTIDSTTRLFNRRHMERSLSKEISLAVRKHEPVTTIMLDIDHFKRFNDEHGHAAGDMVLRALGDIILSTIRVYDTACRYGGEEILLVLPRTGSADAATLAERLRSGINGLRLECEGTPLPPVTVSMGIASCPACGVDPTSLLRSADIALYRAKELGRNCFVIA